MGNKISLGGCVVYCGFPAKRRKTKRREADRILEQQEAERYEAFLRAEKFKADHPEYCRQAGLPVPTHVPGQSSAQTSEAQLKSDKKSGKKSKNKGKKGKEPLTDVSKSFDISIFY